MKYLDNNGLSYLIQKIKIWLGGKVDKVDGKTLTTNDFTNDYKDKVDANTTARHSHSNKSVLDGITSDKIAEWNNKLDVDDVPEEVFIWDGKSSAENSANLALFQKIYDTWRSTGKVVVIATQSDGDRILLSRLSVVSDKFFLDGGYAEFDVTGVGPWCTQYAREVKATIGSNDTITSVPALTSTYEICQLVKEGDEDDPIFKASAAYGITSANIDSWNNKAELSDIPTGIDFRIVTSLPSKGENGVFYLISNNGSGQNVYDEYIWVNNKFEFIGTTAVDLSDYLKEEDVVAITNAEIDTIVA